MHPARATTRASSPREGRSDDGPTLVETSSGGQQLRRWGRTPTGGFDRQPPRRPEEELAGGPDEEATGRASGFARWDPRLSPRLRAVFLPAGYPDTVSPDYAPFIRWHLGSLMFRNVLEVITARRLPSSRQTAVLSRRGERARVEPREEVGDRGMRRRR